MGAGHAGAWARCGASGAAERAVVGFVAGNFHFEKGAGGDTPFDAAAGAVDQRGCGYDQALFLFDYADGFASGTARSPDIFGYQDALARL
jgi:hypothetical protein